MQVCKYCGSESLVKNGRVQSKQVFKCKTCGHRFTGESAFPKMRVESRLISTSVDMYFEGLSTRKIQAQIEKIFDVHISQVTIWKWVMKYSRLVSKFVETMRPQLLGIYHVDETAIKCKGIQKWFWEIIDEQTRFLVASHLSGSRTTEDVIALFEKGVKVAKTKPQVIYCDGLPAYVDGYNKVFWTMRKDSRPELVRKIGIRAVNNNNYVERLHGTLKDRTRITRGLKEAETVGTLLEGWVVHYNYVRNHQTLGKTPAQASGIDMKADWHVLVKEATKSMVETEISLKNGNRKEEQPIMVIAK